MAKIGEIKRGHEIGRVKVSQSYIYQACELCGKERWVHFDRGRNKAVVRICRSCVWKTRLSRARGEKSPGWKGGRVKASGGYILICIQPDDFFSSMARKSHYITEHRLVMAKHLGRCLHSWEVVHHKNGVKDDNRIENLEMTTPGSHIIEHHAGYKDGYAKGLVDGRNKQIQELKQRIEDLQKV